MVINKTGILEFLHEIEKVVVRCECADRKKAEELFLSYIDDDKEKFEKFFCCVDNITNLLKQDLEFFMESDPAVDSEEEVILSYPGFKAISYYRIAHELHKLGILLPSRIISEEAHTLTGIDIHPGAEIGSPFFIDHGTGVVIGETAIVGKYVKLYQGVTLGAVSLSKGIKMKGIKRHPTIKDHVTIYSNASILGDVTIGENVTLGGSVFLTESVPANTKVILAKPELVVIKK